MPDQPPHDVAGTSAALRPADTDTLSTAAPSTDEAKTPLYEATDEHRFQWYMERRKGYSAGARESYQRYDQTIAAVSAGAIVLSITFLKDIGHSPQSLPWLLLSWGAFLSAGGAGLMSLRTSADCDMQHLNALEALKDGNDCSGDEDKAGSLGKLTVLLNNVSLVSFLLGILLMMVFACVNVSNFGGEDCPPAKAAPAKAAPAKAANQAPPQPRKVSPAAPPQEAIPENPSPPAH